jgi:hypothetical protein
MAVPSIFSETFTPCGELVFEVEFTDWAGSGFPHPVTGEPVKFGSYRSSFIDEESPANRYGVPYWVIQLDDGTPMRVLND